MVFIAKKFNLDLKTESNFTVTSVENGLGRWMLVVVVISVDAYPFFGFLRSNLSPWEYKPATLRIQE